MAFWTLLSIGIVGATLYRTQADEHSTNKWQTLGLLFLGAVACAPLVLLNPFVSVVLLPVIFLGFGGIALASAGAKLPAAAAGDPAETLFGLHEIIDSAHSERPRGKLPVALICMGALLILVGLGTGSLIPTLAGTLAAAGASRELIARAAIDDAIEELKAEVSVLERPAS